MNSRTRDSPKTIGCNISGHSKFAREENEV